eukprot:comp24208_c0_seq1/m.44472 comp24208_c0_seq1/g.44472  ORF comp24208_c0_seq1/g.44472 comp24208_c0_seq1/m.44472 type:complete len:525 (-) comp24208_c0_seq1:476-2050(-)
MQPGACHLSRGAPVPCKEWTRLCFLHGGGAQQMPPPGMFPGGPMPPYMPGYGPPRPPPGPDGHPMSAAELEQRMRQGGPDRNQGPSPGPYGMPPYGMPMPYPPPQGHPGMGPYGPNQSPMMPHHRVPSPMQGMGMPGSPHMHMSPMMGGPPMQMPPGYDNLMTRSEKDFIIRVQMSQLQTNNPQLNDYYFQAYNLKRLAQEQGSHPRLLLAKSHHQARKYEPIVFENTLGKLPAGSIHAPKPLIDVAVTRQESTGPTSARRKLLMSMETAYKQLLAIEDLDNEIAVMPPQERAGPLAHRATMIDKLYALLHVAPVSSQSAADDEQFMRFISVAKAQKLLARAMVYFSAEQAHAIVLAVMRNTLTLDQATADGKQVFESVHSHVCPALVHSISAFPMDVIVSIGQVFSANPSPTIVAFLKTRLGTELLQALFARGNELIGHEKPELKRLWEAVLAKIGGALPGQSKVLFGGPKRFTSNALWLLLADVVPYVPQKWKQGVLDELRPLAQNASANSTGATTFLQRNA